MRLALSTALALVITFGLAGCSTTHEGQSYGEIAAEAFLDGFLPSKAQHRGVWRAAGYEAAEKIR